MKFKLNDCLYRPGSLQSLRKHPVCLHIARDGDFCAASSFNFVNVAIFARANSQKRDLSNRDEAYRTCLWNASDRNNSRPPKSALRIRDGASQAVATET